MVETAVEDGLLGSMFVPTPKPELATRGLGVYSGLSGVSVSVRRGVGWPVHSVRIPESNRAVGRSQPIITDNGWGNAPDLSRWMFIGVPGN
jgi:hypothetical protein